MSKISIPLGLFLFLTAGGFATASAQQPQMQGDVAYASGGVGGDSQDAMAAARSQYNLHLLFAQQDTGGFFADVPVQIVDSGGRTVLSAISSGPYLFARLSPGRYRVTATHNGQAMVQTADLWSSGSVDLNYYWPGSSLAVPLGPSAPLAAPVIPATAVSVASMPAASPSQPLAMSAVIQGQPSSGQPSYVSGGVDDASQQEMLAVRSQYNLHLLFAQQGTGAYHANVPVQITDGAGHSLLSTVSAGPFLYANLPAGRYSVSATQDGRTLTQIADVPAVGGTDVDFYWPSDGLAVQVGGVSAAGASMPSYSQMGNGQMSNVQMANGQMPMANAQMQPQAQGDVSFVSGGVDEAGQDAMREVAGQYNLHLLFFQQDTRAYFAYVPVQIFDSTGQMVLSTVSDGPFLYARLKPGRYRVDASHAGQRISRTADVPAEGGTDLNFSWAGS